MIKHNHVKKIDERRGRVRNKKKTKRKELSSQTKTKVH